MGSNGRKLEALQRVETYLAREQVLRTLGRLPDRELAEIANTQDGGALEAAGVTDALLRSATGDPSDPDETRRRLAALFEPLKGRADRLRPFLDPEVER